jgi:hypothetical protein
MDGALIDGAFLICGHGGEHRKTFIVPKGCIIIVHVQYGGKIDRVKHLDILKRLYWLQEQGKRNGQKNILHDPLNHLPALLEIYQSFSVYQEGDECPDFGYLLFDCLSSTKCYNVPMGVINLDTWSKPPTHVFEHTLSKLASPSQIINYFSDPYRNSIIPTERQVKDKVKKIIEEHSSRDSSRDSSRLFRDIFKGISEITDVTQSELCKFRKDEFRNRVYYHSLCREKRDVTKALRRDFPDIMTLPSDITHRPIQHRPIKNIITLRKEIEQIERLPLSKSHTLKKAKNAIARKRGMIDALTYRIGETITHRTPFIKQMMNSPVYQSRRREEVAEERTDIEDKISNLMLRIEYLHNTIEYMATLGSDPSSNRRALIEKEIKDVHVKVKLLEKKRNNLNELEASMDASSPPPLSYVQENTRWKLDPESHPESHPESYPASYPASPYENTHQHIMEAERYGKSHIRNSYTNHLHDEREQLRRMREAHARFKKGRNEYMEANGHGNAQGNRQENEKDMKGYEKEIKRLEYLTNVVPPFHTSRVKIDKNKQLQEMRNAHARFTTSRKKYMNNKASDSNTNQYKKNMKYFNHVLRGYEKGIHDAENPSDSYTRVNKNGTIKWVRK